jgi:hypothetical protein
MSAEPSGQVVRQRIRNRIVEYLELASSCDAQRAYQTAVQVSVPNEVINQWEDWVPGPTDRAFAPPVFSPAEQEAIASFHEVWEEVATTTQSPLPQLEEVLALPAWERLRGAAAAALQIFMARGKLPGTMSSTGSTELRGATTCCSGRTLHARR